MHSRRVQRRFGSTSSFPPCALLTYHPDVKLRVLGHGVWLEGQVAAVHPPRSDIGVQQEHVTLARLAVLRVEPRSATRWQTQRGAATHVDVHAGNPVATARWLGPPFVRVEFHIVLVPPQRARGAALVVAAVEPQGIPLEHQVRPAYAQPCAIQHRSPARSAGGKPRRSSARELKPSQTCNLTAPHEAATWQWSPTALLRETQPPRQPRVFKASAQLIAEPRKLRWQLAREARWHSPS